MRTVQLSLRFPGRRCLPAQNKRRWSLDEAIALRTRGLTYREIGLKFGVTAQAVSNAMNARRLAC